MVFGQTVPVEWVPPTVLVEATDIVPYIGQVPLREVLAQAGFSYVRVDVLRAGQRLAPVESLLADGFSFSSSEESGSVSWKWRDEESDLEDFDT